MPGQASIQDLPPGLLELCWAPLELCERHRTVPFVCHAWQQQVSSSPQLLSTVAAAFEGSRAGTRFASFSDWMVRYGLRNVHILRLRVDLELEDDDAPRHEAAETLAALLGAFGVAGSIEDLLVRHNLPTYSTAWLAAFSTIRRLRLATSMPELMEDDGRQLLVNLPAWALEGIADLSLAAPTMAIAPGAHLPLTLQRLHLCGLTGPFLPPQISTLSNLKELTLLFGSINASGFSPLIQLGSLRRLTLNNCAHLPACLAQLSGLRELSITADTPDLWLDENRGILQAAWPVLAGRLEHLALPAAAIGALLPASALTDCSRLQTLLVLPSNGGELVGGLRPGPALACLRHLAGPLHMLAASLPVLQAAARLEFLGVAWAEPDLAALPELISWAAQHPTLRCISFEGTTLEPLAAFHNHIVDAEQRKPNLIIKSNQNPGGWWHSALICNWNFSPF